MKALPARLTYRVEVEEGEELELPEGLRRAVPPGTWLVTIEPAVEDDAIRHYDAFLASYSEEDEGLYDDLAPTG